MLWVLWVLTWSLRECNTHTPAMSDTHSINMSTEKIARLNKLAWRACILGAQSISLIMQLL